MQALLELINRCKASVSVEVNLHRDSYQSVEEYLDNTGQAKDIALDVLQEMAKRDTIVRIQFYPDTPIGSYTVYDSDLESAVIRCLSLLNAKHSSKSVDE